VYTIYDAIEYLDLESIVIGMFFEAAQSFEMVHTQNSLDNINGNICQGKWGLPRSEDLL